MRKVWAKEFKNIDSKSEQIRHLKRMLSDLGMSGRMSMEQAKVIKEKREFEQELGKHFLSRSSKECSLTP